MKLNYTQKKLLKLIVAFDEICKKSGIQYTLHGGSLLGAVREQGFIPWDDDADIAMTRDNFKRLQLILANRKKYYMFGNIKKQFRIVDDNSIWIDIFICDYIDEGIYRNIKLLMLAVLDIMSRDKNNIKFSNITKYGKGKQIAFYIIFVIGRILPQSVKINLYIEISEKRWIGNKTRMHRSNDQYKGRKEDFPYEWMENYQFITFEGKQLSIIEKYHQMLVKCYGENYWIPIQDERNKDVHKAIRSLKGGIKF